MKYFALAGCVAAGNLEFFGNQTTWAGNSDASSGASLNFDLGANVFTNGTGACTLTSNAQVSAISVSGFFSAFAASNNGPWKFYNMRSDSPSDFRVMVTGEIDGADFDSADFSVNCDDADELSNGDIVTSSFPNHNEDGSNAARAGSVSSKGAEWGQFVMSWPSAVNVSFYDERVIASGSGTSEISVDASTVDSEDLWFSYECDELAGSYEIAIVNL